jgi:DNA-binding CsgD family transcriptional regulator
MSALVAWLWLFPLFGTLQKYLIPNNKFLLAWNISFLTGTMVSFFIHIFLGNSSGHRQIVNKVPLINLLLMSASTITSYFTIDKTLLSLVFYYSLPFLLGVFTAIYFVFWGTTIYYLPVPHRGRFMALMLGLASIFALIILSIDRITPLAFFLGSGLLVLAGNSTPGLVKEWKNLKNTYTSSCFISAANNGYLLKAVKNFWLPFTFLLLCYNLLAGVAYHTLFPLIQDISHLAPLFGYFSYGVVAVACGYYIDCRYGGDNIPLIGLAFLGITFLFIPLAVQTQVFLPLQILLESSYALTDILLWFGLAMAASTLNGHPVKYYALGLFLNIFFILSGVIFNVRIGSIVQGQNVFYVSIFAGMIFFAGVFPALTLRRTGILQQISQTILEESTEIPKISSEDFTVKEKEIIQLILLGLDNEAIAKSLKISKNTLKTHIRHIYNKAGVKNRSELIVGCNRKMTGFTI